MKTRNICKGIALMAMALTTAACQNELNEETNQPKPGEKATMTIRATQGTTPQTRTIYDDQLEGTANGIVVKWEGGTTDGTEKINVYGYDDNNSALTKDNKTEFTSKANTINTAGTCIDFTGTPSKVYAKYLAVYPALEYASDAEGSILPSFLGQTQNCTKPMAHLKDYDFMVGVPTAKDESQNDKYDNFEFTHKAAMMRFDLTLPTAESITKVSLSTSTVDKLYPGIYIFVNGNYIESGMNDQITSVPSLDLAITNHTAATTLKAYMMIPPFDASGKTLKVTVTTVSNTIYEGSITAAASQDLTAGNCYTLKLTLESNTVAVPPVTAGGLTTELGKITSLPDTKTEMALTGTVNATDIAALATFLKPGGVGAKITTLDLSGLTFPTAPGSSDITVTGFKDCTTITEVKLPSNADAIGDDAFNGCTALTTVSQEEEPITRAIVSSRLKSVGARAYKGTAITDMFLHGNVTSIGDNAFENCTVLKALVFEGTKSVGTTAGADIVVIGTDIISGTTPTDLKVFLPNMKEADKTKAITYKTKLSRDTYYNYTGTVDADKLTESKYTQLPNNPGATAPGLPSGTTIGDTPTSGK